MQSLAVATRTGPTPRRSRRAIAYVLAIIVMYVLIGLVRGPALGTKAFADSEAPRDVSAIHTTTLPPFIVTVTGTVTEAEGASYMSSQMFFVEPFSGWWLDLSQLGIAPAG